MCRGVRVTNNGSRSDDWIYWCFFTITLNYNQYSAIANLHTFQFTVAHALGFSVSTGRLLAMDLNIGTTTSNHYEAFLSFLLQSPWTVYSPILSLQSLFSLPSFILLQVDTHYTDAARTCHRKHMSHDCYPLLCDVTTHTQAAFVLYSNSPGMDLQKTNHVTATHCCCVTSPCTCKLCARCVAMVCAWTQRNHCSSTVGCKCAARVA
jgi:hypothetical protein